MDCVTLRTSKNQILLLYTLGTHERSDNTFVKRQPWNIGTQHIRVLGKALYLILKTLRDVVEQVFVSWIHFTTFKKSFKQNYNFYKYMLFDEFHRKLIT